MVDNVEEDAQANRQSDHVLVYSETPKPILVGAEDFQNLVQRLTGGKRKRKPVTFAPVNVEKKEEETHECSSLPARAPEPPAKVQEEPLLAYLDRLDKECPPASTGAGGNRGFFATAGLVKGVRREEGLELDTRDCPRRAPLGSSARTFELEGAEIAEKASGTVRCVKVLPPLSYLQGCKRVCSEWVPEWTGCLSPRSGQVVEEAKRTAARWNRAGLGPWKINLEKIAESDRSGTDNEVGYPVDILYYKGEVTMVEQA